MIKIKNNNFREIKNDIQIFKKACKNYHPQNEEKKLKNS